MKNLKIEAYNGIKRIETPEFPIKINPKKVDVDFVDGIVDLTYKVDTIISVDADAFEIAEVLNMEATYGKAVNVEYADMSSDLNEIEQPTINGELAEDYTFSESELLKWLEKKGIITINRW